MTINLSNKNHCDTLSKLFKIDIERLQRCMFNKG